MKIVFSQEELTYVGNFFGNLIRTMKPNRQARRNMQRLASKFTPSARYVWLKPNDRALLSRILHQGISALAQVEEQTADGKTFFAKATDFVKGGSAESKHALKVGEIFTDVILKLGA